MGYQVNGLKDIYTIVSNERKLGGAVEAEWIRLRTGEQFENAVITCMDMSGVNFYSIGFVTQEGKCLIVHINDISMISQPKHKRIKELTNPVYKERKTDEKLRYMKRLCDLNEGACTKPFIEELEHIVEDIGMDIACQHVDLSFMEYQKVIPLHRKVS